MIFLYASRSIPAYDLLAAALGERYGLGALPRVARAEGGKPFFPKYPRIHFNVSHSGDLALCGLGDTPVGVDIETILPRRAGLPQYALTQREYDDFLREGGTWEGFYALWTRREAWCKYTGEGVALSRGQDIPEGPALRSFEGTLWRAAACADGPIGALQWL